jgi:uridine kinase
MQKILILLILLISTALTAETPFVIGIAGGTGSGKTTLARKIQSSLASGVVLIEQDSYYRDLSHLSVKERQQTNFDHPNSIDFERLRQDIIALKEGQSINKPIYNFKTHSRENATTHVEAAPIIIVEGILIFSDPKMRELFDLKIYVETDHDVRILRRIERDTFERGRDFANIKDQYIQTVKPMHNQFVEPSKQFADVIIPGESDNSTVINLILPGLRGS